MITCFEYYWGGKMEQEYEEFRTKICEAYSNSGVDIVDDEPFVYNNEQFWKNLCEFKDKDYLALKKVFNSYTRPNLDAVNNYNDKPVNKITNTNYKYYDDKIIGIIPMNIPNWENLLNLIIRYEREENKHVHKGTLYYFLGQQYLLRNYIEKGLLFINKAFMEDDMNHNDSLIKFPNTPAYKFLILNMEDPNQALKPLVEDIGNFINNSFLSGFAHSYDDFLNNFLNEAANKIDLKEAHLWLDHVIFFNNFIVRLKYTYNELNKTENIFDSISGEIVLSSIIGDLCLLIESTCKVKLNLPGKTFKAIYNALIPSGQNIYNWAGGAVNTSNFKGSSLITTLGRIFNNNYKSTNSLENSFHLTWGLRNNFHHNIESMSVIKDNFKSIINKQLEFFFDFIIDK
jgi:hypothetical protein